MPLLPAGLLILWQNGFQLLYGFLNEAVSKELHLSLSQQTAMGLAYLLPYSLMQWPAGWLLDRYGAERLLAPAAMLCTVGAALFANADSATMLVLARGLTGSAAAFAFPGLARLARNQCAPARFTLVMALAEGSIGFGGALLGLLLLLQESWSWRTVARLEGALVLGLGLWMFGTGYNAWKQMRRIPPTAEGLRASRPAVDGPIHWPVVFAAIVVYTWEAGLVFAFGGFWNRWMQLQQGFEGSQVQFSSTLLFTSVGLSTLLMGLLGQRRRLRCLLMLIGTTVGGLALLALLLRLHAGQATPQSLLLLILGAAAGCGALAFGEAGLAASSGTTGRVIGLVNAVGCMAGGLFQVLPTQLLVVQQLFDPLLLSFLPLALAGWIASVLLVIWSHPSGAIRDVRCAGN
jgi:MFS family permease